MTDHGVRDHATWAASATARNWHCAGALALARFAGPDRESEAAAWGTACHQLSEKCLRSGADAVSFVGETEKTKKHSFVVDDEMANCAQEYIDVCRELMAEPGAKWWIEERFSLEKLKPPFDAGGTGDFVCYLPAKRKLIVVDLKGGRGVVVEVIGNPQGRTYGLGAMLAHRGLDVETVEVIIVQPRAAHKSGTIRSEEFHVADLAEWTADLVVAMNRSKEAMDAYDAIDAAGGNTVLLDGWRDEYLQPGKCQFCPVEGSCPALRRDALSVAKVWFDDMDQPQIGNSALDESPEALARDLDMIDMLEDWIKARRSLAHNLAEAGTQIPRYQLVDKIGNRKWSDETAAMGKLQVEGFTFEQTHVVKAISPAQADKLLGAKRKGLLADYTIREVTGTNLVAETKTSRPAAKTTAERFFES